jgi:hypothetical protein
MLDLLHHRLVGVAPRFNRSAARCHLRAASISPPLIADSGFSTGLPRFARDGLLIDRIGFTPTVSVYCVVGNVLTALIALRRREALWPLSAPANANPAP